MTDIQRLEKAAAAHHAELARVERTRQALRNEMVRSNARGVSIRRIAPIVKLSVAHVARICADGREAG